MERQIAKRTYVENCPAVYQMFVNIGVDKSWIGPDRITDRIRDRITDRIRDRITDRITDRIADRITDRITEKKTF